MMHDGHRERLRQRFLREGLDGFEPHNVLELLLFYSIPRRDTNEIAHQLIKTFGSVPEVMNAPISELVKIEGVGENTAILLKLMPQLCRMYGKESKKASIILHDSDDLCEYLLNYFIGMVNEIVVLMLLDNNGKILFCDNIFEGTVNAINVNTRKIVEYCIRYNAVTVVVSHNHPRGAALPSKEDLAATITLKNALSTIGVMLLDHIIVAGDDCTSMAQIPGIFDI